MSTHLEIERKYLIRMPDEAFLATVEGATVSNIKQTYLYRKAGTGTTRVRKEERDGKILYTYTVKYIFDDVARFEEERPIDEAEYNESLERADLGLSPIIKRRWRIPMERNLVAEIDIYPGWKKQAICEVETPTENEYYSLPEFIEVIREVTGDPNYSNRSMAFFMPVED